MGKPVQDQKEVVWKGRFGIGIHLGRETSKIW